MDKKRINEYFEGTPDNIYDSENKITWSWDDDKTICFGFFQTSLDGRYEFLTGIHTHRQLATKAAEKLIGKAMGVLTQRYESYVHWIEDQCYDRSYGIGRYWKFNNPKYLDLLCFWYEPSSDMVARIVRYLKIDPSKCLFVFENAEYNDFNDVTVQDYINQGVGGDDENENIEVPFKIDKNVEALIRSYNQPRETFASRKEKKGWNSMAQRNATIYQESKEDKKENINNIIVKK
jgi:hypothetical protein